MYRRADMARPFRTTLLPTATALLFAALLSLPPTGCGGGGGKSSNSTPYPEACSKTAYLPNYADNGDGSGMNFAKWKSFPVRIFFDPTAGIYTADRQTRAVQAMNGWVNQTSSRVNYTVVGSAAEADIVVRFVKVSDSILSSRSAVGLTFVEDELDQTGLPADHHYLASADVYIGIDGDTFRENGTMGHELGHALGIGGHSPTITDLMYRSGSGIRSQTPTTADINTLRTAYCDSFTQAVADSRAVVPPSHRGNRRVIE